MKLSKNIALTILLGLLAAFPSTLRAAELAERVGFHYEPSDGELGDVMPFFWKGVYHVFYLRARQGQVNWGHISSLDLLHWKEHPDAIRNTLTGSIIEKDGLFHAFYTAGGIRHATSPDLEVWQADPAPLFPSETRWYEPACWRDPCVVWNPQARQYWLVICARTKGDGVNPLTGCAALATSPDLRQWTLQPPLWAPQSSTWIECPDLFPYGDKWVLIHYWRETRVRVADTSSGPWRRMAVESPDGFSFSAAKTLWDGQRRVLFGWIPHRPCYCQPTAGGCTLGLPREFYLLPDGTPATRPAAEVIKAWSLDATGGQGGGVFKSVMSQWSFSRAAAAARPAADAAALALWAAAPTNFYFRAEIRCAPGARATLFVRGQAGGGTAYGYPTPLDTGYGLHLDPSRGQVSLRRWYEWEQRGPINEMTYPFSSTDPTVLEVFVDGEILEAFLDHRRSLVGRISENRSGSLGLLAQDGEVTFGGIQIRALKP